MVLKCDILIGVMRVMPLTHHLIDIPTAAAKSFLIAIGVFLMDRFHTARVFRIQTGDKCGLVSAPQPPPLPSSPSLSYLSSPRHISNIGKRHLNQPRPVAAAHRLSPQANRMMDLTESEAAAMQIRSRNPGKLDNERAPFSALETIPKSLAIYSPH
ncbi:unnamed protein product [Spirodela intermedia]|uniref:Uncharacterized protein n=1 Tax=Spirodela intermedia TaxID=51605 RepID=A0A7I8JKS5_SPIIN|nr:unnamed protein product [Spirodela intermedia]CAA6670749.1 unnamed protein product [Spirodela intermedia]